MRRSSARVFMVGVSVVALCGGCRPSGVSEGPEPAPDDPFAGQAYAQAPLSPEAKVFLIAGGDDVANFAAEVIEQRALWKKAGLRDEEIACYYAKPSLDALREDGDQLHAVAPELSDCYPADPATVHGHLREVAGRTPEFVYVFVSSHGLPPVLRWKAGVEDANELPQHLELERGEIGKFDRHAIGLEAGDGPGLGEVEEMLAAHRAGESVESVMFSPDTLAAALEGLPETTQKFVVLQACFSGGFIGRPDDDGPSPLTKIPQMTMMTATSPGRPSFGCSAGAHRTYYGGTFNRVLAEEIEREARGPVGLPWPAMHERVVFVVETMEAIDGERPSQPGFFTNVPGMVKAAKATKATAGK